jgi:PTS system galactitol-specific IIA component
VKTEYFGLFSLFLPMLSDFLKPAAIALHLTVRTSQEVIEILGARLLALGCVKPDFVAATLKREADMPTGLALGGTINAAIPHVDCEFVNQPALALGTLQSPVIFYDMVEAGVEVPVQLVIMLALDQPKSQIEMLQRVSGILQQPALIQELMAAQCPAEVLSLLSRAETEP